MKHLSSLALPLALTLSLVAAVCLISCATAKSNHKVDYTEAHGYFVRNDAPAHFSNYFDSQEAFDRVFGCAAVMGADGQPTTIDFSRQSVVAVVGDETDRPTEFFAQSLTQKADTLLLRYRAKADAPASYTMRPVLLLVIDKPATLPLVRLEREQ